MEEKRGSASESHSDFMRVGRLEQRFASPQQGSAALCPHGFHGAPSCDTCAFEPSGLSCTLLFIFIYMCLMSTHLRCWKTHFWIQGKGASELSPVDPLPKWHSSPFYTLHFLSHCWQKWASWGRENPRPGLLSGRAGTQPFPGPVAGVKWTWWDGTPNQGQSAALYLWANLPIEHCWPVVWWEYFKMILGGQKNTNGDKLTR